MKTAGKLLLAIGAAGLSSGCTVTKCNLTGTQGGAVTGHVRMTSGSAENSGTLPYTWSMSTLWMGEWNRIEECEYRKGNTNDLLLINVRTHGFKGEVSAPPGTTGVRVVRDGSTYRKETF